MTLAYLPIFRKNTLICTILVHFSSRISDFEIDGNIFEVGGKKKKQKQIQDAAQGYVVKDDIETGYGNIIPLWQFGLTY